MEPGGPREERATVAADRKTNESKTIGGGTVAILSEVAHLLERFAETGERGAIDFHSLPMAPGDYEWLRETLGRGEVSVTLDLGSPSYAYETQFHGAWWVQHCAGDGEVAAEYLEIGAVPHLLLADPIDVRRDVRRLRTRIAQSAPLSGDQGVANE